MQLHLIPLTAAIAVSALFLTPTQSAAFEMGLCDFETRSPDVPADAGPEGWVDFFIEPGLLEGEMECLLYPTVDAPWFLEVHQQIPGGVDTLSLAYLEHEIHLLLEPEPRARPFTMAHCERGQDPGTLMTCTTHLRPDTRWLRYVRHFDANLQPLRDVVQVNAWDIYPGRFSTHVPGFYRATDENRTATLVPLGGGASWDLASTDNPEVFEISDPGDVADFLAYVDVTQAVEFQLNLAHDIASDAPLWSRTSFSMAYGQDVLRYGRNLENVVLRELSAAVSAE